MPRHCTTANQRPVPPGVVSGASTKVDQFRLPHRTQSGSSHSTVGPGRGAGAATSRGKKHIRPLPSRPRLSGRPGLSAPGAPAQQPCSTAGQYNGASANGQLQGLRACLSWPVASRNLSSVRTPRPTPRPSSSSTLQRTEFRSILDELLWALPRHLLPIQSLFELGIDRCFGKLIFGKPGWLIIALAPERGTRGMVSRTRGHRRDMGGVVWPFRVVHALLSKRKVEA